MRIDARERRQTNLLDRPQVAARSMISARDSISPFAVGIPVRSPVAGLGGTKLLHDLELRGGSWP